MKCRDCGAPFDLASQNYYDNLCPSCVEDERTWPLCHKCSEKVSPDNMTSIEVGGSMLNPGTEYVPAHEECAEDHLPPGFVEP
jgi:hypothetical protein